MTEHPARALPEEERGRYLLALAALVYADGVRDEAEVHALRQVGQGLGMPDAAVDAAVEAMREPDRAAVDRILGELSTDELKWAVLTDAILITFADRTVAVAECKEIAEYAERLGISVGQAVLIGRYVEHVLMHEEGTALSKALAEGLAEAKAQLNPSRGLKWLHRKLEERRR